MFKNKEEYKKKLLEVVDRISEEEFQEMQKAVINNTDLFGAEMIDYNIMLVLVVSNYMMEDGMKAEIEIDHPDEPHQISIMVKGFHYGL